MTGRIILTAGRNTGDRTAAARVMARENNWPLLSVTDLTFAGSDEAKTEAVLTLLHAQVEADVPGVVVSAPFIIELNTSEWLNDLNYDLGLRGYEATVVYVLAPGEPQPGLDPEHYFIDETDDIDDLFTVATSIAGELRGA